MQDVRNNTGKLVCRIDPEVFVVEIVNKGQKTLIVFDPGNQPKISNTSTK